MSIAKRIAEAIEKIGKDPPDPEGAVYQLCSALEDTATRLYEKKGRESYKKFVHENMDLITRCGGRVRILNLRFGVDLNKNRDADEQIIPDSNGTFSFEQVLYHVVRCGLYHTATLPPEVRFGADHSISVTEDGVIVLPPKIIIGLIVSIVASPVNVGQHLEVESAINLVEGFQIPLNKCWGKRAELLALFAALDALQ